jgi:hypothetical protein
MQHPKAPLAQHTFRLVAHAAKAYNIASVSLHMHKQNHGPLDEHA